MSSKKNLNILALEAYDGGSHKQFLDGLIERSTHRFVRIGLPARKWKWRMRGAALYFIEQLGEINRNNSKSFDLIVTSDMTSVADLKALLPPPLQHLPIICYFHENQLTYPVQVEDERDYQYGFTNITSALATEAVWFNSHYHQHTFLDAVDQLLKRMPDCIPVQIPEQIEAKSTVMPLGLPEDIFQKNPNTSSQLFGSPPVILWNHRWEHDKNPEVFFNTLIDLDQTGTDFRLIVAGENFRKTPPIFTTARKQLAHRIDHFGFAQDRKAYVSLLQHADIVVSTSIHEFFGLSVLEAIAAGCVPVLPKRLSYPDLLPVETHHSFLYANDADLGRTLSSLLTTGLSHEKGVHLDRIRCRVNELNWSKLINRYDDAFAAIAVPTHEPDRHC